MRWTIVPFTDVLEDVTGGNEKTKQGDYAASGAYPIVDQGQSLIGGYTDDANSLCKANAPVIVFGDHTKALKYVDFPFCLGADGTKVLKPKQNADTKYLYYALHNIHIPEAGYSRHFKYLKAGKIPLPPLEEQKRIAGILDQADALRRLRTRALDKLNTLGQAIFHEMFGEGLKGKLWPEVELKDAVAEGTIVTYGIVQAGDEYPGGVPYIRTGDIKNGEISTVGLRHTSPEVAAKFERSKVRAGEIVMSIRATVGTTAIVPEGLDGSNLTQGTARIAPGVKTNGAFLNSYLQSLPIQTWIQRQVKGATFREITLGRLRELPVALPPMEIQKNFASAMSSLQSELNIQEKNLGKAETLFAALQHRAFRGEL